MLTLLVLLGVSIALHFGGYLLKHVLNILLGLVSGSIMLVQAIFDVVYDTVVIVAEDYHEIYYEAREETYEKLGLDKPYNPYNDPKNWDDEGELDDADKGDPLKKQSEASDVSVKGQN